MAKSLFSDSSTEAKTKNLSSPDPQPKVVDKAGIVIQAPSFGSIRSVLCLYPFADDFSRLDLPSGHVEPGETPLQAAIRECFEEIGLELSESELTLFNEREVGSGDPSLRVHYYWFTPISFPDISSKVYGLDFSRVVPGEVYGLVWSTSLRGVRKEQFWSLVSEPTWESHKSSLVSF